MKRKLDEFNFIYALAEHCNLNCAGCDHFAPVARPQLSDFEEFGRDIERLSEIFEGKCRRIGLMGGEPLLNPEIEKYLDAARVAFPEAQISIVTNGLLLGRMEDSFYDACLRDDIEIEYTKYPVNFDYEEAHKTLSDRGIKISAYGNSGEVTKTLYFIPLDLDGGQDAEWNFEHCFHANNCIQLKHGKLYTCTIIPNIDHFNLAFGQNVPVGRGDFLDIYDKSLSRDDVLDFLARPVPFCRYCNVGKRTDNIKWRQSEHLMGEWVIDN